MITAPQREFYIIRRVVLLEELIDAFEGLGRQFMPPFTRRDRQIEALLRGYPRTAP